MAIDRRWALLDEAKPPLLDAFASTGVTRIEVVAAFPEVDGVGIWLCTTTDVQSQETVDREYEGSWFYATR